MNTFSLCSGRATTWRRKTRFGTAETFFRQEAPAIGFIGGCIVNKSFWRTVDPGPYIGHLFRPCRAYPGLHSRQAGADHCRAAGIKSVGRRPCFHLVGRRLRRFSWLGGHGSSPGADLGTDAAEPALRRFTGCTASTPCAFCAPSGPITSTILTSTVAPSRQGTSTRLQDRGIFNRLHQPPSI